VFWINSYWEKYISNFQDPVVPCLENSKILTLDPQVQLNCVQNTSTNPLWNNKTRIHLHTNPKTNKWSHPYTCETYCLGTWKSLLVHMNGKQQKISSFFPSEYPFLFFFFFCCRKLFLLYEYTSHEAVPSSRKESYFFRYTKHGYSRYVIARVIRFRSSKWWIRGAIKAPRVIPRENEHGWHQGLETGQICIFLWF
jgi:hypothetical protein